MLLYCERFGDFLTDHRAVWEHWSHRSPGPMGWHRPAHTDCVSVSALQSVSSSWDHHELAQTDWYWWIVNSRHFGPGPAPPQTGINSAIEPDITQPIIWSRVGWCLSVSQLQRLARGILNLDLLTNLCAGSWLCDCWNCQMRLECCAVLISWLMRLLCLLHNWLAPFLHQPGPWGWEHNHGETRLIILYAYCYSIHDFHGSISTLLMYMVLTYLLNFNPSRYVTVADIQACKI